MVVVAPRVVVPVATKVVAVSFPMTFCIVEVAVVNMAVEAVLAPIEVLLMVPPEMVRASASSESAQSKLRVPLLARSSLTIEASGRVMVPEDMVRPPPEIVNNFSNVDVAKVAVPLTVSVVPLSNVSVPLVYRSEEHTSELHSQ